MTRIPLPEMAHEARPRLKAFTLRPIETTRSQAKDLAAIYLAPVRVWEAARQEIVAAYAQSLAVTSADDGLVRDDPSWVRAVIEAVAGRVTVELSLAEGLLRTWLTRLSRWHLSRIVASLKYAIGIDLTAQMSAAGGTLEDVLARNVALVRNVSDQTRARIEDAVYRGLSQRLPARGVAKEIAEATGLSRKRALRIAADQTVKASAALDRQRMADLGFTQFVWRHSGKLHPREWHLARNGKVFDLNAPALRGDMPGDQPFCGCMAQAHMEL